MSDWEGRRVLVTGGSSGIGLAIAAAFASSGALVWLVARDPKKLAAVAEGMRSKHVPQICPADLASLPDIARVRDQVTAAWDRLDVLVNNAGTARFAALGQVSPEEFEQLFALNVRAPYFLTQACLPLLEKAKDESTL